MAGDTDPADEPVSLERRRVKAALRKQLFAKEEEPVKVGRFVVTERLGAGGMGVVYAAYDPKLKREVAIKLVRVGAEDVDQRLRLEREAQAMARLTHPNVLPVYEVGEHDGQIFVAMQLVKGETLRIWAERKTAAEIIGAYRDAARGLAAAHDAGLVHRDFKPENVMVGEHGVRVMDFGLARAIEETTSAAPSGVDVSPDELDTPLTRTGTVLGTPAYMSPEQHRGEPADARSDQFSFCVALWEALAGERPFAGETYSSLRDAVLQGKLASSRGAMPAWVEGVVRRGLAVDPGARHDSMTALADALQPPTSWTRRLGWVAGVGALVGVAAVAARSDAPATPRTVVVDRPGGGLCTEPPSMTAAWEAWEPTLDEHVAGLHALGLTDLHDAGRAFASRWDETRAAVCAGEAQSKPAQLECLQGRLEHFEATKRMFAELPDVDVRRNAIWALPKPSVCGKEGPAYDAMPGGDAVDQEHAWEERVAARCMSFGEWSLRPTAFDPGSVSDPVARLEVERNRLQRDRVVIPPTPGFMTPDVLQDVESMLERAEAAGARTAALHLMFARLVGEINNAGIGAGALGIIVTLRANAQQLDDDFVLSIMGQFEMNQARTPEEREAIFATARKRVDHPRFGNLYLAALEVTLMEFVAQGRYDQVIAELEERLPPWLEAEQDAPRYKHMWFGELDRELYERAVGRYAEIVDTDYRPGPAAGPYASYTRDWLEWDTLRLSEARAREILAKDTDDPLGVRLQLMIALQLRDFAQARALLEATPQGGLRQAFEMQLLDLEGKTDEALKLTQGPDNIYAWHQRAPLLARSGELAQARAMLEATTRYYVSRVPYDLQAQGPAFFKLAKVLHQLGPEHHARALRMAKGALAMFELGGGSLFERDRQEIRAWLAERQE